MSHPPAVRHLKADRILETMLGLNDRIAHRFPDSSLRNMAEELVAVVRESLDTVANIRKPNIWLRVGIAILVLAMLALIVFVASGVRIDPKGLENLPDRVGLLNNVITSTVFMLGLIGFLVTLEIRFKRQRAVHALHELRSMAHIVDMHQLRKDPESFLSTGAGDPAKLPPIEMARYLQYCTELLSILSKLAALYVEGLPDPQTLEAADRLEALTTSLSRKIWQKISLLDTVFQPHMAPLRKTEKKDEAITPETRQDTLPRKEVSS
jgi:hypothetical protein